MRGTPTAVQVLASWDRASDRECDCDHDHLARPQTLFVEESLTATTQNKDKINKIPLHGRVHARERKSIFSNLAP